METVLFRLPEVESMPRQKLATLLDYIPAYKHTNCYHQSSGTLDEKGVGPGILEPCGPVSLWGLENLVPHKVNKWHCKSYRKPELHFLQTDYDIHYSLGFYVEPPI